MSSTSASDNVTSTDADDRLRRIRALLAKAENTPYPDEADTYMAKVSELIARWGIDEALLWATEEHTSAEQVTATVIAVDAPYANRKVILVDRVAAANGCRAVHTKTTGDVQHVTVVGFPGDVARVELLTTSLLIQLTRAVLDGGPTGNSTNTAAWRRSFITAYALRIGERLQADRDRAAADTESQGVGHRAAAGPDCTAAGAAAASGPSTSTALVLAGRDAAVAAETKARFPRLRTSRISDGGHRGGHAAGRSAADRAQLGARDLTGARAQLGA